MKIAVVMAYAFFSATIIVSFLMPVSPMQRLLKRIGNYWLDILLYILLAVLVVEICSFADIPMTDRCGREL